MMMMMFFLYVDGLTVPASNSLSDDSPRIYHDFLRHHEVVAFANGKHFLKHMDI